MSRGDQFPDDASRRAASPEFDLAKYFSLTCLILFVTVTSVMCVGFYHISTRYIRMDAEAHAVPVADWMSKTAFTEGRPFPQPGTQEREAIRSELRGVLPPLQVFKIKVYDTSAKVIYSTDSTIAYGQPDPDNKKLQHALLGTITSELESDESVWDLDSEVQREGAIVETYVPVKDSSGRVIGVMEIYQDVTATYERILPALILIIVIASVLAMGTLYGVLYWFIRRAHLTIRAQTQTIRRAKTELESYAVELERRVSERTRQLQESLAQQQQDEKMVAVGTLAAGVAHELNTPLGTILGSVQMILDHCSRTFYQGPLPDRGEAALEGCRTCIADLSRIESQTRRCREIVSSFVGFSRKSSSERSWFRLADLVAESISLVEPKARQTGVQIVCKLAENTPPMRVSGNEILQVIVNIASNAIDAMPDGGELTIKCYTRGETARIEIRDTGTGMDETTTQRIFEPFFTTKEVGRGTGLGLAVTYRIVREHGGRIMVHSVPGEGSTFTVCLPIDGSAPGESARVGEVAPRNVARPEGGDR